MFALVLFVCYLDGGCDDIVVDVYDTEQQCLYSMDDQRIRHGGCFPVEDLMMDSGCPRSSTATFSHDSTRLAGRKLRSRQGLRINERLFTRRRW